MACGNRRLSTGVSRVECSHLLLLDCFVTTLTKTAHDDEEQFTHDA